MLIAASKLVCNYQKRELHAKHRRVLMHDSNEICEHMQVSVFSLSLAVP